MGRGRRDKIYLSSEQRERLEVISRNGHAPVKKVLHARVLLLADEGEGAQQRWSDEAIADAFGLHRNSVARIRKQFLAQGEGVALNRKVRQTPPVAAKIDGELEAQLVAICCSQAPEGRNRWTLSLLVNELTNRKLVSQISRETVRQALKKMNYDPGKNSATASLSGMQPDLLPKWSRC